MQPVGKKKKEKEASDTQIYFPIMERINGKMCVPHL